MTSSRTSSILAEKKLPILCDFVKLHVANNKFSDKFNNGLKK